jgi:signal transduction histidine kinase
MLINWLQRHPRITDWGLFLVALASAGGAAFHHERRALGFSLALLACVPLLFRRQRPLLVLALSTAATALIVAVWGLYNPIPVGLALFTVASQCDRRRSLVAGGASILVLAIELLATLDALNPLPIVGRLLGFGVAWLIGDSVGTRRRYVDALEERAERLERERAAEAARAVAEEQARIARELHDVIAHNVSVMVVQAAAANDVFVTRPDRAREALRAIERTGRSALDELRRLLGGGPGDAPYAPQPGIEDLDGLFERVRAAGLRVVVAVEGEQRALPPAVELSAYRVVQEALTNTLKHAHATQADVRVRYAEDELDVLIHDDGVGLGASATVNGSGRGLVGMRERLALLGGSLAAGPADGGGYTVSARFPLGASA